MSILEDQANKVANEMVASQGIEKSVAFDPLLILAIISIIIQIINYFMTNKKTPKEALDKLQHPGILEKYWLRLMIWKKLGGFPSAQGAIQNAMYKVAKGFTEKDVADLVLAVQNRKGDV